MGKDLFDFTRQSAPARDDRGGGLNRFAWAFRGPERPRQFERRSQKAMRRAAAREEGAVGAAGEEHSALPARSHLRLVAARINLRDASLERRAILSERAGVASWTLGPAEGCADVHERLREIARPAAWRQHARCRCELDSRASDRLFHSKESSQNAGDIAVDRRGLAAERDRRDGGGGIGANAGKRPQFGFLARKRPASSSDLLGASVKIPRSRIIAEARERAHDVFDWGRSQVLDPGPFRDESLIIRRCRPGGRLLQQDL